MSKHASSNDTNTTPSYTVSSTSSSSSSSSSPSSKSVATNSNSNVKSNTKSKPKTNRPTNHKTKQSNLHPQSIYNRSSSASSSSPSSSFSSKSAKNEKSDFKLLAEEYPDFKVAWEDVIDSCNRDKARVEVKVKVDESETDDFEVVLNNTEAEADLCSLDDDVNFDDDENNDDAADTKLTPPATSKTNPSFSSYITPNFNLTLTRSLLHRDFKIQNFNLPDDCLCPMVGNRLNYCLFVLCDLLGIAITYPSSAINGNGDGIGIVVVGPRLIGLDVGTGPSVVYPLLLHSLTNSSSGANKNVFYGSEINKNSVEYANKNVSDNCLEEVVKVIDVSKDNNDNDDRKDGPILQALKAAPSLKPEAMDFTICNPPFYPTTSAIPNRQDNRKRTNMVERECCYEGGEVAFITELINDSLHLFSQIDFSSKIETKPKWTWHTTLINQPSNFKKVKEALRLKGIKDVKEGVYGTGGRTQFFLGWRYCDFHKCFKICEEGGESGDVNARIVEFTETHTTDSLKYVYTSGFSYSLGYFYVDGGQWICEVDFTNVSDGDGEIEVCCRLGGGFDNESESGSEATPSITEIRKRHKSSYEAGLKGRIEFERIYELLVSEVRRSNRRWRRKLKRGQE